MARVIRAGDGGAAVRPAEVWDARSEAAQVLRKAKERARAVVATALAEADAIRTEAREEGARRGRAEAAGALLVAAAEARTALEAAREDVARLAIAVSRRILSEEIRLAPERVDALVRAAMATAGGARRLRLLVHPDDAARAGATATAFAADGTVAIHVDPALGRGDCVLETEGGSIDARIEVQLAALERELLAHGRRAPGHAPDPPIGGKFRGPAVP